MRIAACIIALVGTVIGLLTATLQSQTPVYETLTIVLSLMGTLGGVLIFIRPRIAMWLLFAITILGAVPDAIMWEGAGSFFLVSALLDLSQIRRAREA